MGRIMAIKAVRDLPVSVSTEEDHSVQVAGRLDLRSARDVVDVVLDALAADPIDLPGILERSIPGPGLGVLLEQAARLRLDRMGEDLDRLNRCAGSQVQARAEGDVR